VKLPGPASDYALTGIQLPCDRFTANASAAVPAMTTARISADMMVGQVSFHREVSQWTAACRPLHTIALAGCGGRTPQMLAMSKQPLGDWQQVT
jgi:hypothetical protein